MSHSRWLKSLLVQKSEDLLPVCFGVQPLPSCVGSLEPSWETLSPETLSGGYSLEGPSFVALNRCLRSPRGSQVYWVSSSVFFHGLTPEYWIQESCPGTLTAVRVESVTGKGPFHVGWRWAFGDISFHTLIRTWVPGAYSGDSLRVFWVLVHTQQAYILLELPNGHGIRLEGLNLWI